jgi:hypothetical protein
MALSVKFPILTERTVFSLPALSEQGVLSAFRRLAEAKIARVDAENAAAAGLRLPRRLIVDGVAAPNLARIKSSSLIVARWSVGVAAVDYIFNLLHGAGPLRSGRYRDSMRMYIDGAESKDPRDAHGAREALFLSTVPYARKIERGQKGYAPGHVYEAVADMARARFGDAARIKFTYAEPEGPAPLLDAWVAKSAVRASATRRWRRSAGAVFMRDIDKKRRQPAIVVLMD